LPKSYYGTILCSSLQKKGWARSLLKDLSRPSAAAHETLDTDDPFVKKNLRVMLEFVCLVPIAPDTHSGTLKSAKKTQYNNVGWPYIGPIIKDDEMKVRVVAESILTGESHSVYEWVLHSRTQMEPRFSLSNVKFIFADQLITISLLKQLGMEKTCTLRCDYHHVLNGVWPKYFGTSIYSKHKNDFRNPLHVVGNKKQWEYAFHQISITVRSDSNKTSYLLKVYNNPEYYAGWWLRNQEGHLNLLGSVPAEQNHASIKAHLGDGAMWYVADHARRLMERQSRLTTSIVR
jgi:hypothetical protein